MGKRMQIVAVESRNNTYVLNDEQNETTFRHKRVTYICSLLKYFDVGRNVLILVN